MFKNQCAVEGLRKFFGILKMLQTAQNASLACQKVIPGVFEVFVIFLNVSLTLRRRMTYIYGLKRAVYRPSIGWPQLKTTAFSAKMALLFQKAETESFPTVPKLLPETYFQSHNRDLKFYFHEKKQEKNAMFKNQCAVKGKPISFSRFSRVCLNPVKLITFWVENLTNEEPHSSAP